ncbi:hypothetical protein ACFU6I_04235 [Streptomyces sp. NPDC057486]|uniref:hypothetical protein n=1 Tax=Streptomyces sp. NPDC057486 TaxID=3346145 RepID=UPI003688F173
MPPTWISQEPTKNGQELTLGELGDFVQKAIESGTPLTQPLSIEANNRGRRLKWIGVESPAKKS